MRILMISHTYLPAQYRGKLRWLATEGGIDFTLAALPELCPPTGTHLVFEPMDEPFRVRLLRPLAFPNNNSLRLYAPHQMAALIREVQPDLVHVEAEPHSLSLGLLVFLKPRFGYRLVAFTWENLYRRGRRPLCWLEPFTLCHVDWMIAGNREAAAVVRWRGYAGPTTVIPQVGLDSAHFQANSPPPDLYGRLGAGLRIGFVGRLVPEKGVMDLLEAFLPLADRAFLVLLGEGPLRDIVRQRAEEAGVADRVALPGFIPYRQIPAYLKGLDILVLPSRTTPNWKEQFGHILVEAMLTGVPMVGSDSGAIPEVIGEAGLTFPEGNVTALRERLIFLMEHPEKRRRLAEAGQRRALAHFTDVAIGQATLQVYQQVLEGQ
jgi:glycosyltransferase involved in cell wall biosynthesis